MESHLQERLADFPDGARRALWVEPRVRLDRRRGAHRRVGGDDHAEQRQQRRQAQFGGIHPNDMWTALFALQYPGMAAYQKSDQAFIDEWNNAIDLFGKTFSGVTLVAHDGRRPSQLRRNSRYGALLAFYGGLPQSRYGLRRRDDDPRILRRCRPSAGPTPRRPRPAASKPRAARPQHNMGVASVKNAGAQHGAAASPRRRFLGGAQFNTGFLQPPSGKAAPPHFRRTPPTRPRDAPSRPVAQRMGMSLWPASRKRVSLRA